MSYHERTFLLQYNQTIRMYKIATYSKDDLKKTENGYEDCVTFSPIQRHFGLFRICEFIKHLAVGKISGFTTTTFHNKSLNLTVRLTLTLNMILKLPLKSENPSIAKSKKLKILLTSPNMQIFSWTQLCILNHTNLII